MNTNLLIVGAGIYGLIAKEIAEDMGEFDTIGFVDDYSKQTPNGIPTLGTSADLEQLSRSYSHAIVAIGNAEIRLKLLKKIEAMKTMKIATLISPRAHISRSARLGKGCIIEPMAVVHTGCSLGIGCLISAGAVINHLSALGDGVHVDCNATVAGYISVPDTTRVERGTVWKHVQARAPLSMEGFDYSFEDGI